MPNVTPIYQKPRFYNPAVARFTQMDSFSGDIQSPQSLHKYLYCQDDPVNFTDPSGQSATWNQWFGYEVEDEIEKEYARDYGVAGVTFGKWARVAGDCGVFRAKPDILDNNRQIYMEIKPLSPSGLIAADAQMLLRIKQFASQGYSPDLTWHIKPSLIYPWGMPTVFFNVCGVLFYTDAFEVAIDYIAIKTLSGVWSLINSGALANTVEAAIGRCLGLAAKGKAIESAELDSDFAISSLLAGCFGVL
jgi:RHS repeat-associated protein